MKKVLYDADFFIAKTKIPIHGSSRTNTSDILDYVISSIQNLSISKDLSLDHAAILFNFTIKINKSVYPSIKVKIYYKTNWNSINAFFSSQLANLQDGISNLINSKNPDPINIINNAANILTDIIIDIHNHLPEKTIKPNTSIPLTTHLLIKQQKIKTAFMKNRNPFLKSTLLKLKREFREFPENFQLSKKKREFPPFKRPEKLENFEKRNGIPKGVHIKNDTVFAKQIKTN